MMRFSHVVIVALMSAHPDISIFDSKTHPGKSWIVIDDCAVEVDTVDFKMNPDKVLKKVNDFCDLNLDGLSMYATKEK